MKSTFREAKNPEFKDNLENNPMNIAADLSSSKHKTFEEIKQISLHHLDEILSESMQYLNKLDTQLGVKGYLGEATKVIEYLVSIIPEDHDLYHELWTRFFDIANKKYSLAHGDEQTLYRSAHSNLIKKYITHAEKSKSSQKSTGKSTDWRIVKKMRQIHEKIMIDSSEDDKDHDGETLLVEFKKKVEEAKERLFWKFEQTSYIIFAKVLLLNLFDFISKEENKEKIWKAILEGRFDKKIFAESNCPISQTLILGENGGLYVLINSLKDDDLNILRDAVGEEYLSDKIKKKEKSNLNKILIGKGAFGTVKFAISLFFTETSVPGKVVCIKKTNSIKRFNDANRDEIGFQQLIK